MKRKMFILLILSAIMVLGMVMAVQACEGIECDVYHSTGYCHTHIETNFPQEVLKYLLQGYTVRFVFDEAIQTYLITPYGYIIDAGAESLSSGHATFVEFFLEHVLVTRADALVEIPAISPHGNCCGVPINTVILDNVIGWHDLWVNGGWETCWYLRWFEERRWGFNCNWASSVRWLNAEHFHPLCRPVFAR